MNEKREEGTMKLSEAIRLGAMMHGASKFHFWDEECGSCALGAALQAVGRHRDINNVESHDEVMSLVHEVWPFTKLNLGSYDPLCPCHRGNDLASEISWAFCGDATREQIADWVATIEPAESEHDGRTMATAECAARSAGSEHGQAGQERQEDQQASRDAGTVSSTVAV